ncbi:uncharacterized protein LOC119095782 [Pollicipes pollicipes]|uniref:uncharacterized protein LOC119095782 n=1 Tax=Pollicipes pollicipes TaxID=41117 RepID=UPI001884E1CB|nr:uncharacterized protein LOC119095782 [Pollicipes pollicipes]
MNADESGARAWELLSGDTRSAPEANTMMQKLLLLACLLATCRALSTKRERAEVIDGRVELEYQARITAVRKVIRETEFVTKTQTIIDSPYCVSYAKDLPACTPTEPIKPSRTMRRMAKSVAPEVVAAAGPPPTIDASIDGDLQVIELVGVDESCMNQDEGVTFLTTLLETQTMTVTRTRPGAQTVTISIDGCLPSPMPFNAPTC